MTDSTSVSWRGGQRVSFRTFPVKGAISPDCPSGSFQPLSSVNSAAEDYTLLLTATAQQRFSLI
ncbi:MAG: hypothetical protein J6C40_06090 [Lentisphaeria bacterium]|nr:hypothetical protein [Lentisphaeria bacterium]